MGFPSDPSNHIFSLRSIEIPDSDPSETSTTLTNSHSDSSLSLRHSELKTQWPERLEGPQVQKTLGETYELDSCLTDGCTAVMSFVLNDFMSYLRIDLSPPELLGEATHPTVVLKFNYESCRSIEFRRLSEKPSDSSQEQEIPTGTQYYIVILQLEAAHLNTEQLFADGCPHTLSGLQDTLRARHVIGFILPSSFSRQSQIHQITRNFTRDADSNKWGRLAEILEDSWAEDLSPFEDIQLGLTSRIPSGRPCLRSISLPFSSSVRSTGAFFDKIDYYLSLGLGTLIEQAATEAKDKSSFTCKAWIIQPDQKDSNNFTTILLVPKRTTTDLSQNDAATAQLHFASKGEGQSGHWNLKVVNPLPGTSNQMLTAALSRRLNSSKPGYEDTRKVPVITSTSSCTSQADQVKSILKANPITITVTPTLRHGIFHRVFEGLRQLMITTEPDHELGMDNTMWTLLLGRNPSSLPRYSIYDTLSDPELSSSTALNLNDSQLQAIELAKAAPGGFAICHGGPGTGKTHFVTEAIKPFLADAERDHRILVTAAANRGVDALAVGLNGRLQSLLADGRGSKDSYVLRVHSEKTEKAIVMQQANLDRIKCLAQKREKELLARKDKPVNASSPAQLSKGTSELYATCQDLTSCRFQMVDDDRVEQIALSVGRRFLYNAGLEPECPSPRDTRFFTFRGLLEEYRQGEAFSPWKWASLEKDIKTLLRCLIEDATVVCCTVSGAGDDFVCTPFSAAEVIVVDESARVPEFQWWPLFTFYRYARGKILVGDPDQLQVPTQSTFNDSISNPFSAQLEMSLQERLQLVGMPSTFFTTQYRAVPEIAAIYNKAVYHKRLINDESTMVSTRPLAEQVQQHNAAHYNKKSSVIFYTVDEAKRHLDRRGSTCCEEYAIGVMNILAMLLRDGFGGPSKPCTIAILTPYMAQYEMLRVDLNSMVRDIPKAKNVILDRLERVQGLEYDIVIVDPAITTSAGFLTSRRLNVLFSRARCGLYLVGAPALWYSMRGDNRPAMLRFNSLFLKYRYEATTLVSRYHEKRFEEGEEDY